MVQGDAQHCGSAAEHTNNNRHGTAVLLCTADGIKPAGKGLAWDSTWQGTAARCNRQHQYLPDSVLAIQRADHV